MAKFYDGTGRMREPYPGEQFIYSPTLIAAALLYSPLHLLGLAITKRVQQGFVWSLGFVRGYG